MIQLAYNQMLISQIQINEKKVLSGLDSLKSKVEDLDVGKLKTVPIDLKELSDIVDKKVLKKLKNR